MIPTRRSLLAVVGLCAVAWHGGFGAQPTAQALAGVPRVTREQMWANAPDPTYPPAAVQKHVRGRGLFLLKIDPQQRTVGRVTILQSTGSKILDDAAVQALSKWRLRRGGLADRVDHVKVPVSFIQ
jgi:TonB family protein